MTAPSSDPSLSTHNPAPPPPGPGMSPAVQLLFLLMFSLVVGVVAGGLALVDGKSVSDAAQWFGGATGATFMAGLAALAFLRR